ncbi:MULTISPECIES: hypothetical protein [Pseudomonas]|uniref:Uncharacterized protein n=1 Tax=Pseudomonas emilianonis TaxID=2915812 RepID=A0ABT0EKJ4_9PSED|nr:hypothetical protein [Pseudomonas emilianonis]MCK1786248.1 hypothetical protein [Pseudomonas emilianonis]
MPDYNRSTPPGAPNTIGRMDGTIEIDRLDHEFHADYVHIDEQEGALRFFGSQKENGDPDRFEAVEVHLTPPTISTGTYLVGGEHVKKIAYVDPQTGNAYNALKGEVSLTRSTSLKTFFGSVDCEFRVEDQTIVVAVQYYFKGYGQ